MDENVKIIVEAVDRASSKLKTIGTTGKTSFTELNSAIGLANQAWGTAQRFINDTAGAVVNYANQVRELTTAIGATPEEASKLIQVADDMNISYGQLMSALEAGIRKGVKPTIENLAALSDEYLRLNPGVERTEFLMDKFGRTGQDLARIMELGSEKIAEMGDEIEGTARLMDQDALDAAEDYRLALDALSDSMEDVKLATGRALIPALNDLSGWWERDMKALYLTNEAYEKGLITRGEWIRANSFLFGSEEKNIKQLDEVERKLKEEEQRLREASAGWSDYNDQIDVGVGRNRTFTGTVEETNESLSAHAEALAYTAQKVSDARAAAAHASERWGEWNSRILGSISAMETLNTMQPNFGSTIQAELDKIEWEKLGGGAIQLAYGQIMAALEDDRITKPEAEAALGELKIANAGVQAEMDGLNVNELAKRVQEATGGTLEAARAKAAEIQAALEAGTLGEYVYDITLRYNVLNPPKIGPGWAPVTQLPQGPPKAAGGYVSSGVSYPVGEHGVEMFTPATNGYITPNNALGGGDTYNNIVINTLPGQSPQQIAAHLFRMQDTARRRMNAGAGYAGA